ncbi:hypothetical protein IFM89_009785 [Coptis chinensis]|uniref:Glycosyl transferase family 51 domain-containing protein n=1 Tax=Coptis chinensis TaxID=261450 RepID=A0A835I0S4_9MAGN|nr:hypothetical protein IFM89_009785 [Coptis chinensis]
MAWVSAHLLQLTNITPRINLISNTYTSKHSKKGTKISFPIFSRRTSKRSLVHLGISSYSFHDHLTNHFFSPEKLLVCIYIVIFLLLRLVFTLLPPDFPQRWHDLIVSSEKAEAEAINYPSHLFKAIVAYEDRRFFWHCGVDPVGVARAVLLFPKGGGGSTITQQLVKNTFLTNDRTLSRKAIEMLLALILERKLSKSKILCSYLSKASDIYWGHGVYGIESASNFYFGKHPTVLTLGESAMLAGIIPAPELRSPFNEPSRGKTSQARALRRMVDAGFIDIEAALSIVNQRLYIHGDVSEHHTKVYFFSHEEPRNLNKGQVRIFGAKDIWDWERESKVWETRENMERWAMRVREKRSK